MAEYISPSADDIERNYPVKAGGIGGGRGRERGWNASFSSLRRMGKGCRGSGAG